MYIKELIHKEIPYITQDSTVKKALKIINKFQLSHIPLVKNNHLLGMISEECLLLLTEEEKMKNAEKHLQKFQLSTQNLLLDTFKLFHTFDSNIIPIVNAKEKYYGVLLMEDIVTYFAKFPFISENGAIMVLEIPISNYSMAEISRIVESNNTKLFGAIITQMNTEFIEVTLKISSEQLTSVGETFERYGYTIKHKYYIDKKEGLLEDRYQQLQKYLKM